MLRESFSDVRTADSMVPRWGVSYRRIVVGALYGFCGVLAVGIGLNAAVIIDLIADLLGSGMPAQAVHYLIISGLIIAFDLLILAVFLSFVLTVGRRAEFFSAAQTTRLVMLGALNAGSAVVGLLMPRYSLQTNIGEWLRAPEVIPDLDLNSLMFSMMFFALAGVFEYARILQEDSDSIL